MQYRYMNIQKVYIDDNKCGLNCHFDYYAVSSISPP